MNNKELGCDVTTPASAISIKLLGLGTHCEGLSLSRDETDALAKLYKFDLNESNEMMKAGATRNLLRYAKKDGLRMIAVFAKHLESGRDPVKELICLMSDAGWDISDSEWAFDEETNNV